MKNARIVSVQGVSKSFSHRGAGLLRQQVANWIRRQLRDPFYALKNVSFEIDRGGSVAIVGANGSGKSTLLSLICGLTPPDSGVVQLNGRVAALLDLGTGLHYDLTGAENLRLNASLVGLSSQRVHELFDRIVEFSELGDFIHEPLRTYSTGMVMRLTFSVAMHVDPDVLIIDEVLAVGDRAFQEKCFAKLMSFRTAGHTLLVASHFGSMLREICSRAIWLDHGNLIQDGDINNVLDLYEQRRTTPTLR